MKSSDKAATPAVATPPIPQPIGAIRHVEVRMLEFPVLIPKFLESEDKK